MKERITMEPPWENLWLEPEGPYHYLPGTRQLDIQYITPPDDDLGSLNGRISRPWRYTNDHQPDLRTTLHGRAMWRASHK